MVKLSQVVEGSVVQLGKFRKGMTEHSFKSGIVAKKFTLKVGNSVYTGIAVQTDDNEVIEVSLHNIQSILA